MTLALGSPGASRAEPALAFYPLQPRGVEPASAEALDATLRHAIEVLGRFRLFGRRDVDSLLSRTTGGLGVHCPEGKAHCLAALGRLLGAGQVLFGEVAPGAVTLWLIDARTEGELRRVRIEGPSERSGREALIALLTPDLYVGRLAVAGGADRLKTRISVDGEDRGQLGSEPLELPVGRHLVAIGGRDRYADVRYGETTVLTAEPGPSHSGPAVAPVVGAPPPAEVPPRLARHPAHTWAFALGGLALAVAIGAGGFGLASNADADAVNGRTRPTPVALEPLVLGQAREAHDFAVTADVLFGAAVALGATAVLLYVLDPGAESAGRAERASGSAVLRF